MQNLPRTEFSQALKALATERRLDVEVILETIRQAIAAAYRRDAKESGLDTEGFEVVAELDPVSGEAKIFSWPEGKEDEKKDVTPPGFGRIAAQTAKQVIHQKIREAEKDAMMSEYKDRVGSLVSGMILRFDGPDARIDLGRAEGILPASERTPNERLNPNQRLTFLLKEISETIRGGIIVLSRADKDFVKKLFEREVPEIGSGSVEIRGFVREAGIRSKVMVSSNQPGVDPVGSCVGQKGVRVQSVTNELGGERVDIIPFSEDDAELIKAALSPADNLSVDLNEKEKIAVVTAPSDQLSLAIGKEGQNARLASKLTGWKIEIVGDEAEELKDGETEEQKNKRTEEQSKEEAEAKESEPESGIEQVEKKEDAASDTQTDDSQSNDTHSIKSDGPVQAEATNEEKVAEKKEEPKK